MASWSCKKDSEPGIAPAVMECKVDNVSWRAVSFTNKLSRMTTTLYTGKRLDITAASLDGSSITLSISDPSTGTQGDGIKPDTYYANVFQNLPPDYQSGTPVKGAIGTYATLSSQRVYTSSPVSLTAGEGQITITACDGAKKTVSGSFSFKASSLSDASSVSISAGTFTNLTYRVAE